MFKIRKNNLTNELGAVDAKKTYDENAPITLDYPTVHIISGSKGSGKSSMMISMLRSKNIYKRRFNNIFLISPTAGSGADPKMLKLVEELEEDGHYFTECSDENYQTILDMIKESNHDLTEKGKKPRNLLILDDCLASMPRNSEKGNKLNEIIIACRHLFTNIILLVQKYNSIPTLIRSNTDYISFYPSHSRQELDTLIKDLSINEKLFKDLLKFATNEKYSFLHINLLHGNEPLFFKKFDRILI